MLTWNVLHQQEALVSTSENFNHEVHGSALNGILQHSEMRSQSAYDLPVNWARTNYGYFDRTVVMFVDYGLNWFK